MAIDWQAAIWCSHKSH